MKAPISCIFPCCPKCGVAMGTAPFLGDWTDMPLWDPMKPKTVQCLNVNCDQHAVRYVMQPMLVDLAREDAPR